MTKHTRVAIVGGGIYGCGLLLQLVEKGWTDVTLIEKNELTAGSTWHAAGFCTHYSFNLTHLYMRKFSTDLYYHLEQEGIEPTGYHRCRGLRITDDSDRIDEFRHGIAVARQLGMEFELLGPSEIEQVFPLMNCAGVKAAVFEPTEGYVDPAQATNAMARMARAGGAKIIRQSPVQSIQMLASGEWQLSTPNDVIVAEHIVLAPGFWANEVGKLIGLDLPVTPMLHQYLVTDDHPSVAAMPPDSIPLVRHHDYQWYTRRERDGLLLGAYESIPLPQTWSIDGVPPTFGMELLEPELDRVEHLISDAMGRIPMLTEAGIKTTVHGPVSYTPDGQPLIGPASGLRNAWLACGSGFGIGEGAGAGKLLAEWMVEGQPPMHMGAFDPRRFGAYADKSYRVERAVEVFAKQFSTHYPLEERESGRPLKTTPIYQRLKNAWARFGCVYGWERANWFGSDDETERLSFHRTEWFHGVARECRGVTENAGIIDLSGFTKYQISGPHAELELDKLSANQLPQETGDIRLCHMLNHAGTVECEFTITRTAQQSFYLVCAALAENHHLDWLQQHFAPDADIRVENLSQQQGVLSLAGPRSRQILQSVCDHELSNGAFPWLTAKEINVLGIQVLAMRLSYTGELGWEIHHAIEHQAVLYDGFKAAGDKCPPIDFGFYALNSMRMEKAHKAWGGELTVENTPWELGLERFMTLENREFIGRPVILESSQRDLSRRYYYVEIGPGDTDVIGGEPVYLGAELVGVLVSGAYGHRVGKDLGFALMKVAAAENGDLFETEMIGIRRSVKIIPEPAFDPNNTRARIG